MEGESSVLNGTRLTEISSDDRDVKIMSRAFKQFPALNIATIFHGHQVPGRSYIGSREIGTKFDISRAKALLSNTGAHTLPAFTKALAAAGVKLGNLTIGLSLNSTDSKQVRDYDENRFSSFTFWHINRCVEVMSIYFITPIRLGLTIEENRFPRLDNPASFCMTSPQP